ncbi:MAG TPA: SGNH/GDSL hydrolase family protein [Bacteroidia bacterium]
MKKVFSAFALLASASLLFTCKPNLKVPKPSSGDADFSRLVAIGGDFLAGYQDGALYMNGQQYSLPGLLAKNMALAGGGSFAQPLMPDNSGLGLNPKPWESRFETASTLGFKSDCKGVSSLFPLKNNFNAGGIYLQHQSGNFQNMSVPLAKIAHYNKPALGTSGANPFYARFASNPGVSTMLSDAKSQQPTFFILWAGMEDVYEYVSNGAYGPLPISSTNFGLYLDSVISVFGIKGAIANIPDFASLPFFTTVPWNGLDITKNQADSINLSFPGWFNMVQGKNGFVIADSHAALGYRKMVEGEYVLISAPLDSMKCGGMGSTTGDIPSQYILDTTDVRIVNKIISDYNNVISLKAQKYNLALVDMNSYFKKVQAGIKWDGVDFNAAFVSGGFFSLDGYHPNQKGYSLLANEFVRAINAKYNSTIPWVNCPECSGIKFP